MAPVYDFRHVELDKIGRGKRIVKPPGGECSDIFGVQNGGGSISPRQEQITPTKAKNYMQSNIFSPDSVDSSPHSNGHSPVTPSKMLDTQERLFGGSPDDKTPSRKIVNRQRSSIFEDEVTDSRPKTTPARRNQINPITGEPIAENGTTNGSHNGTPNGSHNGTPKTPNGVNGTNGYIRRNYINPITGQPMSMTRTSNCAHYGIPNRTPYGINGFTNGHSTPESPMNGNSSFRVRNPPGGKSSGIF